MDQEMEITGTNTPINSRDKLSTAIAIAAKLEATFVAEMLKVMGSNTEESSFSGGIGEQQFQSFLLEARAEAIVERGGLGLKEAFAKALEST